MPTGTDISTGMTTAEAETSPERRFIGVPPSNVFVVNDCFDAGVALNWVESNMLHSEGTCFLCIVFEFAPVINIESTYFINTFLFETNPYKNAIRSYIALKSILHVSMWQFIGSWNTTFIHVPSESQ